ncbi:MAG TPA: 4-(cytidine 5'-diphospho)-2-C-methyl-D-erythritol kinase, partial [Desulfatiglandales bacterium]|nr:4-(cytidine 5'-diphospho)-2-C-methyl-D-erythritol kinase [Desulfatiglandales bacterium]
GKRPDGYHEVEMLMQMVGLYDEVKVVRGGRGITVRCDNNAVPSGEGNIAWKAAAAMLKFSERDTGLSIEIRKAIPVAAGLGGGSGDAAAVLVAANRLLGAGLNRERLAEVGAGLGMDVPFFFFGPTALARGRGEVLTTLAPLPKFWVLLVNPGFETSTAWVYKNLNLRLTKKVDCNKIARLTVRNIAESLHNDLETVTATMHPVINRIKEVLLARGAMGACMSGSGPTVFGIFETEEACRAAAKSISGEGWKLYPAEVLTVSPLGVYHTE